MSICVLIYARFPKIETAWNHEAIRDPDSFFFATGSGNIAFEPDDLWAKVILSARQRCSLRDHNDVDTFEAGKVSCIDANQGQAHCS